MASKSKADRHDRDDTDRLSKRKCQGITWSCDVHGEPVKFYSTESEIALCNSCASSTEMFNNQNEDQLRNIEEVIIVRRKRLNDKLQKTEELERELMAVEAEIKSTEISAKKHLQTVSDRLTASFAESRKVLEKAKNAAIKLLKERMKWRKETDEKVGEEIKTRNAQMEQEHRVSEQRESNVLSELQNIGEIVCKNIKDLTYKTQHARHTAKNMASTITRIIHQDKSLVIEAPGVIASIDENQCVDDHRDVTERLGRLQREVDKVDFFVGTAGGREYARIDGYVGEWELVRTITLPSTLDDPLLCGGDDDKICVHERYTGYCDDESITTYVTNINTGKIEKIIEDNCKEIVSCAALGNDLIVCGNYRWGDEIMYKKDMITMLGGLITIYDKQWNKIRDISIPNCDNDFPGDPWNEVVLDVDRNGMIIAAQYNQPKVYFINPHDGGIENTFAFDWSKGVLGIDALSSGNIAVRTGSDKVTIISEKGQEVFAFPRDHSGWFIPAFCAFDKITEIAYFGPDGLSEPSAEVGDGEGPRDAIIQGKMLDKSGKYSDIQLPRGWRLVTPSGNLISCDGDKLVVYKKKFTV
ncbi:uncharacterized protein LOC121417148 [Lytechinus variegatus]|uniref:uncharacterized protein LOC121417148 n=1 Tax=Lytechinus variegatus TaxID=7654 RepID=UPI001BB0FC48|nr:uncharacterized protein LOC121417148 [Lytechinus variegatus]